MWLYNGCEFTKEMIGEHYGFVYVIENNLNGKKYIGRKYFYSKRTLPPLKGKTRKRHVVKDSGWQNCWSSSKIVQAEVKKLGEDAFTRNILSLHPNKTETNYHEMKIQFQLNILEERNEAGERLYYNENINTKFYPSEKFHTERMLLHEKYENI